MSAAPQITILIIEDERPVRESFKYFLEDLDYTVLEAEDGAQGIKQFNLHKPDIVITDLRMPNVDGHAVLETLAKQSPDTPLIVASGTGNISDTVQALQLGAWDYLLNPVTDLSILEHALTKSLDRARLLQENRDHQRHLESEVQRRTQQLTDKLNEITRFNKLAVGRERRVIELKHQINDLLEELGRKPKYKSPDLLNKETGPLE